MVQGPIFLGYGRALAFCFESFSAGALARPNRQDLLELFWKKHSVTTVHRYLHSLLRVFGMLEDWQYDCCALSQLEFQDAVLSLDRQFSGSLPFWG